MQAWIHSELLQVGMEEPFSMSLKWIVGSRGAWNFNGVSDGYRKARQEQTLESLKRGSSFWELIPFSGIITFISLMGLYYQYRCVWTLS